MAPPILPPPPLNSPLAQDDEKAAPTWARWFHQLWQSLRTSLADLEASVVGLSDASPQAVGSTSAGTGLVASRADHVHAHGNQGGGALHANAVASGAAGFFTGTDKTKLDGIAASAAALTSSSPADVGTTAVGAGTTAARADHVHAHGNQAGGSLHAVAVAAGAAGFLSGTDKTKLDSTSGTNTGDVTLGAFGSSPDAKGQTLSSQVLTQQPADATHPGAISLSAQTLGAGTKTLASAVVVGNLTVDTSTLVVDSTNNWVGVGTASPRYPLDLQSSAGTLLNVRNASTDTGGYILSTGSDEILLGGAAAFDGTNWVAKVSTPGIFGYSNQAFRWYANTGASVGSAYTPTNRMTLSNAGVLAVTGNVGAGLTTPTYRGEFVRASASGGQVRVGTSSSDDGLYFLSVSAESGYICSGVNFNGSAWLAKATAAGISTFNGTSFQWYVDTGLSPGGTYGPTSRMTLSGNVLTLTVGVNVSTRSTTAATVTMVGTDEVILASANGGAVTVNLQPAATAGNGRRLTVVKTDASANSVTLDGSGGETLNGAATKVLAAQYDRATIVCDGSAWYVVG